MASVASDYRVSPLCEDVPFGATVSGLTRQAQIVINQWLRQYNHIRPHHALAMRPPVPETLLEKPNITGPASGG